MNHVLSAVLFDLDGTLLPMDMETFVKDYLARLAAKMAPLGYGPEALVQAVWAGTRAMVQNQGGQTNETVFWNTCAGLFDRDVRADEPVFLDFYRNEFQLAKESCGFNPLAAKTVAQVKAMGLTTVLATNPLFPAVATHSRIRWAGLAPEDFAYITTYENSSHCKPNPDYYREILDKLGLKADNCLMVGNDAIEDLAAREVGIDVFLLTDCLINRDGRDISGCPNGSFPELLSYIRSL